MLAISSGVMMSVPFFTGRIIDRVFGHKDPSADEEMQTGETHRDRIKHATKDLRSYMLGLAALFTVGALATFGRVYLMNFASERVVNRLRTSAFGSIVRQDVAFFDKSKTGELINRLSNDVWYVGYATTMNISDGLRGLVGTLGGVGMMFYVSPKLAVVGLSVVPPVAIIAIIYGRYIRSITRQRNDALADASEIAEERFSNMRTVKAFGAELKEEQRYNNTINVVLDIAQRESLAKGGFYSFNSLSGNFILLTLLFNGGSLITQGVITVGDLSSFLLYAVYVGVSLSGISSFYTELMHGIGASTRLFELIEMKPTIPLKGGQKIENLRGGIVLKNVHFSYPTRKEMPVLKGLNLVVPEKSTVAIVGASGSGKSTIAALLLRFYDCTKGSVAIDGIDVKQLEPHWLRQHIGTVNQEPILFSCSIKENIAYGVDSLDAVSMFEIEQAARRANAFDFIKSFPKGFDTVLGERGITLSGGQKQRIAIARALLRDPKILLMDEATSALDAESEHAVRETLDNLMYSCDRTIIIIAHRLSTIRNADQIAVLHEGKVAEVGSYWQLMGIEEGLFRKLVQRQTVSLTAEGEPEGSGAEESEKSPDEKSI